MSDDHYAELHVTPEADARDIKKAYFGLVRQFPPETHPEQFQKLRAAYEVLSNPEARKAYDASRGAATASEQLGDELAVIMRNALAAIEADEFERAVPLLEGVVGQRPEAEEARVRLCACLLRLNRPNEAARHATELARHHPGLAQAPMFAGYAAQSLKRNGEARAHFVKASELDPLDLRAVRSVVGVDLEAGEGKEALAFLEKRLESAPESVRLGLRMERISVLLFMDRKAEWEAELATLEREATTVELKEELGWFYEREAASAFARSKHASADLLLGRLAAVAPERGSVALTRPVTLPLSAVPPAALAWLTEQKKNPELLSIPGAGLVTDSFLLAGAAALFCGMALLALRSDSVWSAGELVFLCLLFTGSGALLGGAVMRWLRSARSPVGRFSAIHRLFYIDVDLDTVHLLPMVRLSQVNGAHQGNNGVYSHTTFGLSFGPEGRSFSMYSQQKAEDMGRLLHELRGRLLDLLHSGMLAGEEGADFLPAALLTQPPAIPPSQNQRWVLGGAALGLVLCLGLGQLATRTFETQAWLSVLGDPSPTSLRGYLATAHPERFTKPAEQALSQRRAQAIARLKAGAPRLAQALESGSALELTTLHVELSGEASYASLVAPAGERIAELPPSEFSAEGVHQHEDELIAVLQQRVDQLAGAGWISLKRGTGPLTIKLAYQLSLSGSVYRFKAPGAPLPLLWPEARLAGTATFGEVQRALVATSARQVRLSEPTIAALQKGNSSVATQRLFETAWVELADQLASLLFSSAS